MKVFRETRSAQVAKTPEGIVVARIKADIRQTVADAVENITASADASEGSRAPILVDLRHAVPLDAETRHYYMGKRLDEAFTAIGILVSMGAFGKMMGNLYLSVAKPGIPARLFTSEDEAHRWLEGHLG